MLTFFHSLYSEYALFKSETCSAWLVSQMREKHTWHLELKDYWGAVSFWYINNHNKEQNEENLKDLTTSLLQYQVTAASETQHNSAHARQVTSHNSVHSDTCHNLITGGREYTNGHIHSQKNNWEMEETLKRPPKAFSLSTKYTLLHYNSKK